MKLLIGCGRNVSESYFCADGGVAVLPRAAPPAPWSFGEKDCDSSVTLEDAALGGVLAPADGLPGAAALLKGVAEVADEEADGEAGEAEDPALEEAAAPPGADAPLLLDTCGAGPPATEALSGLLFLLQAAVPRAIAARIA